MSKPSPSWRRRAGVAVTALVTALTTAAAGVLVAAPAQAANKVTPGNLTGYGFDQCTAPSSAAMDAWMDHSPFLAAAIYISGDSRGCLSQPNLTPTWVSHQLRRGWRLLPITLGPQAWCTTRERYRRQERINPDPDSGYAKARAQGRREANETVAVAQRLGIVAGSTLWYDIEAFDTRPTHCRESALSFLSAWTNKLHRLGYVSGVYSSAASGIRMLDDVRVNRPNRYALPDRIWIADWNGKADLHSTYVRRDGWMPHARVHQYRGPHHETHGGVRIDIDSNYLSLGNGSQPLRHRPHCGDVDFDLRNYRSVRQGTSRTAETRALQCRLREKKLYGGAVDGVFDAELKTAVKAWEASRDLLQNGIMSRSNWMRLLTDGRRPVVKIGSANTPTLRLQRTLNAASPVRLAPDGLYDDATVAAVRAYQDRVGLPVTGVVSPQTWAKLRAGVR